MGFDSEKIIWVCSKIECINQFYMPCHTTYLFVSAWFTGICDYEINYWIKLFKLFAINKKGFTFAAAFRGVHWRKCCNKKVWQDNVNLYFLSDWEITFFYNIF